MAQDDDQIPDYLADGEDDIPEDLPSDGGQLRPLINIPVATHLGLPVDGSVQGGLYQTHGTGRLYGTASTIRALIEIGEAWAMQHPGHPIGIGDISKKGGGKISGHASHQKGVDVDIRPLRRDGAMERVTIHDRDYSSQLTGELIRMFAENDVLDVTHIFFNDPSLQPSPVQRWPNHDNHLHVRFRLL
jgi:hypothetical protein